MPVLCFTIGSRYSNRPESCVDVVDASTIDLFSCATPGAAARQTTPMVTLISVRRLCMKLAPWFFTLNQQFPCDEPFCMVSLWSRKERLRRPTLDYTTMMKQNDLAGDTPGFSEIVRGHNDLDAARTDGSHDVL